jgi:cell wall-associated NlpC family hydrolase
MSTHDRRLTPVRADLASEAMRGIVESPRYVAGTNYEVSAAVAPLRPVPSNEAGMDTEALHGERFRVFDNADGWAWGQLELDGYVGYLPEASLRLAMEPATHRVQALRTFVYPSASIKFPPVLALSMGAMVRVEATEGDFARTPGGFFWQAHLAPIGSHAADFVTVAERFLETPYLWGGKSSLGLDCSALCQLSLGMAGITALRDSDLQRDLGTAVPITPQLSGLRRGDLLQWKGHCGIMLDDTMLIHANGHHMAVAKEPVIVARDRILAKSFGPITGIRRLPALGAP